MQEKIILVDQNDQPIGEIEKLEAHKKGLLHRAVSVFIFNSGKKLLIQKRAERKYHSSGLWTNTACTHPSPNETNEAAAIRCLNDEMGLKIKDITKLFHFTYKTQLNNGLIEHEFDHVFIGFSDDEPTPSIKEVSSHKYIDIKELKEQIELMPDNYTFWFKKIIGRVSEEIENY